MEAHARAPEPLVKTNDMTSNWHSWKEDFIIFMKVTGYINKPNEIRANLLKNRIGKIGIDAIQNMTFDKPEDKDDMDILIEKLEEFFNPPKNEVVERFQFFTRDKRQNETIEQYINILKEKAKTCNFNELTDSIIRDKIILITQDKILRKKFFETKNLDLQKLVAIYNDYNINMEKMKQLTKENINMEKKQFTKSTENLSFAPKPLMNDTRKKCWRCNCQHPLGKCPAWGSKCTKCGDVNHFTQCCKGPRPPNPNKLNDNKINNLLNPLDQANVNLAQANIPKNNKKKNNLANSETKNMDPMNKVTSFPDIPTVPCDAANSTFDNNDKFDFVMLDECKPGPSLPSNNTTNRPAYLNHTQYNNSYVRRAKPTGTEHLLDIIPTADDVRRELTKIKEGMKSEFKQLDQKEIDVVKEIESDFTRGLQGFTGNRKKLDKDPCVLS